MGVLFLKKLSLLLALTMLVSMLGGLALAENPKALEPYAEPIVVNVMREFQPNLWFPEGEDLQDNVLTDFYLEKLNIDYVIKWQIDPGYGAEQLDLAIASNDLPDLFEVNPQQLYRLAVAGQIQPMGGVYEEYVSDKVREALNLNDGMYFDQATVNGEMYGLPEPNDFADGTSLLYIRKDWMDYLGMEAPTTMEELEALALAFMNQDVNEDGHRATYGISMDRPDTGNNFTPRGLSHPFGAWFDTWVSDGEGGLMFSDVQPEAKEYLQLMADWYQKGIFDPEYAVKDGSKVAEDVSAEKIGIFVGPFWAPLYPLNMSMQSNPDAEWMAYPVPADPNGEYHVSAWNTCKRYLVANANFEYPEAAVKGNNLWHELWQGDYAEYYHGLNGAEYAEAGEDFKVYPPFWFDPPVKNINNGRIIRELWPDKENGDKIESPELYKQWVKMQDYTDGNQDNIVGWAQLLLHKDVWLVFDNYYGGEDNMVYDGYTGPVTNDIARRQPLLKRLRDETFSAFIMGSKDFSEWDAYVTEWFEIGGTDMYTDVNEWFKNK